MKLFVLWTMAAFASKECGIAEYDTKSGGEIIEKRNTEESIVVKIEEDQYAKKLFTSTYIGVYYTKNKWGAKRWSKEEKKSVYNGFYDDEETAAHASDTLARKLMRKGEQFHKLNFPDDNTEVHKNKNRSKRTGASSKHIGVSYNKRDSMWYVNRWSKHENKLINNGYYDNEDTAAHASDTLARTFMANGEKHLKLNFPDDDIEVFREEKIGTSQYFGVSYNRQYSKWRAQRRSKSEKKMLHGGCYDNEETAAHASDTLARKLMENGEQGHRVNFPDDDTELHREECQEKKRKRKDNLQEN